MAENEVIPGENVSKRPGSLRLIRAWIVVLVSIVVVQVLDAFSTGLEILSALRCLIQVLILILFVVSVVR